MSDTDVSVSRAAQQTFISSGEPLPSLLFLLPSFVTRKQSRRAELKEPGATGGLRAAASSALLFQSDQASSLVRSSSRHPSASKNIACAPLWPQ